MVSQVSINPKLILIYPRLCGSKTEEERRHVRGALGGEGCLPLGTYIKFWTGRLVERGKGLISKRREWVGWGGGRLFDDLR